MVTAGQNASIGPARRFSSERAGADPQERFRTAPAPSERPSVHHPWPDQSNAFLVSQLLAAKPELGQETPRIAASLAAYQAHSSGRIGYSGPATPVDLRI